MTDLKTTTEIRMWSDDGEWKWEMFKNKKRVAFGEAPTFLDAQASVRGAWKSHD